MNIQGMIETLDAIDSGVVKWDQGNWCSCFAGNFLRLQGFPPYVVTDIQEGWGFSAVVNLPEEGEVSVSWAAQELMGLDFKQASRLFYGENTIEDLHRIVEGLVQEELAKQAQAETPEMQTA